MAEQIYNDSNYRFSDPVRFFKANDPYYFEVDNIPIKQLQENCLWLKDQVRKSSDKILGVKRGDLDELRPYAMGGDRLLRVNPGRYTARINDASKKTPLAYLRKIMGTALGDVDAWETPLPNPGNFPDGKNAILQAALDTFKQSVSQDAMGMNGLVERAFTWPVYNSDTPIDNDGVDLVGQSSDGAVADPAMSYAGYSDNIPGGGVAASPMVVAQALLWAKSIDSGSASYLLTSFESTTNGWAKFPRTENYFIKRWRGISRLAIVDVDEEISIEVPPFDPTDFSYINEVGEQTEVDGVQSRIDLVFIYSKPIDSSGVTILTPDLPGKLGITKPTLGIVRGAGIKTNFKETSNFEEDYKQNLNSDHGILAHPGDQKNINMGFTATSSNDISQDIRGSFPAPDDILNIAPLISEKLEDNAYELVGQSILPVAYVWVQNGSQVVLSTDVIDIRPMFRTAELAYNERAGIGAAFPQLSLANPAVGKGQLDHEIKLAYDDLVGQIGGGGGGGGGGGASTVLATGYVFGGWYFGPEGALFSYYQNQIADGTDTTEDEKFELMNHVRSLYGFIDPTTVAGSTPGGMAGPGVATIPGYPDWDLASYLVNEFSWAGPGVGSLGYLKAGQYPNDYINTFVSAPNREPDADASIVGGSNRAAVFNEWNTHEWDGHTTGYPGAGTTGGGISWADGDRQNNFDNTETPPMSNGAGSNVELRPSTVNFQYIKKRITFERPSWLHDYKVDVGLVNCLAENYRGSNGPGLQNLASDTGSYFGHWVEKNWDSFTIYVSCVGDSNNNRQNQQNSGLPGSNFSGDITVTNRDGGNFSSFIVPVGDLLASNGIPIDSTVFRCGYMGNPRVGKCTYPTVQWSFEGITDPTYHHTNLTGSVYPGAGGNSTITLKT